MDSVDRMLYEASQAQQRGKSPIEAARLALESLGLPLPVLALLREGRMMAKYSCELCRYWSAEKIACADLSKACVWAPKETDQ